MRAGRGWTPRALVVRAHGQGDQGCGSQADASTTRHTAQRVIRAELAAAAAFRGGQVASSRRDLNSGLRARGRLNGEHCIREGAGPGGVATGSPLSSYACPVSLGTGARGRQGPAQWPCAREGGCFQGKQHRWNGGAAERGWGGAPGSVGQDWGQASPGCTQWVLRWPAPRPGAGQSPPTASTARLHAAGFGSAAGSGLEGSGVRQKAQGGTHLGRGHLSCLLPPTGASPEHPSPQAPTLWTPRPCRAPHALTFLSLNSTLSPS